MLVALCLRHDHTPIDSSWAAKSLGLVTVILGPCHRGTSKAPLSYLLLQLPAVADPKLVQSCSWHCRGSLCLCQPLPLPSPALPDGSSKLVPAEQSHKQIRGGPR